MKKADRNFLMYFEDMLESIEKIERYSADFDFEGFEQNGMLVDAVIRNLEIIGEASNKIPKSIKDKYPKIPWSEMYRMRNRAIHEYFGVDYEIIWSILKNYLPNNYIDLREAYEIEGGKS